MNNSETRQNERTGKRVSEMRSILLASSQMLNKSASLKKRSTINLNSIEVSTLSFHSIRVVIIYNRFNPASLEKIRNKEEEEKCHSAANLPVTGGGSDGCGGDCGGCVEVDETQNGLEPIGRVFSYVKDLVLFVDINGILVDLFDIVIIVFHK